MSTLLYYNNQQILSGQPTPLVGKQEAPIRYGERWGNKTTLTLNGQLTGCTYNNLITAQKSLISVFGYDFQNFSIIENGATIFSKPYIIIRELRFPNSNYVGVIPYNITLDCYDQNLFSGVYGVLDPRDEWSFEESTEGLINVNHTISARGFNTNSGVSNGFDNAKNFVLSKTGINPNISPYFITTPSGFNPCLKSLAEKPDRFNGTYSVTETYVADKFFGTNGVLRYSVSFDCDEEGHARVAVNGTIDGCGMAADVSSIRARYNTLNLYNLALEVYSGATNSTGLNTDYISRGYTEDPYARKLSFNSVYDNFPGGQTYLDYHVGVSSGENGITDVTFEGTIKGRGDLAARWQRVQNYYSTFNPFPVAQSGYYAVFPSSPFPLNPNDLTKSVTFNAFHGEINLNYHWDNKEIPWPGFADLSYTLNYTPPLEKIIVNPLLALCGRDYYLGDAGYVQRASFSIEGHGRLICNSANAPTIAQNSARSHANSFFAANGYTNNPLLELNEVSIGVYTLDFKYQWSADGPAFIL